MARSIRISHPLREVDRTQMVLLALLRITQQGHCMTEHREAGNHSHVIFKLLGYAETSERNIPSSLVLSCPRVDPSEQVMRLSQQPLVSRALRQLDGMFRPATAASEYLPISSSSCPCPISIPTRRSAGTLLISGTFYLHPRRGESVQGGVIAFPAFATRELPSAGVRYVVRDRPQCGRHRQTPVVLRHC